MSGDIDFKALSAPIPGAAIRRRRQAGIWLEYITARAVMDRLDAVVGPANWRDEYRHLDGGAVECTLYIRVGEQWVGKTDAGTPSNVEPVKGAYSDAFKRAAVRWGIGRELYEDGLSPDTPPVHSETGLVQALPESPDDEQQMLAFANITWTRDRSRVMRMVDAAEQMWAIPHPHAINRVAKALGLPSPRGRYEALFASIADYAGSPRDAWNAISAYESEGAPEDEK